MKFLPFRTHGFQIEFIVEYLRNFFMFLVGETELGIVQLSEQVIGIYKEILLYNLPFSLFIFLSDPLSAALMYSQY